MMIEMPSGFKAVSNVWSNSHILVTTLWKCNQELNTPSSPLSHLVWCLWQFQSSPVLDSVQ